MLARPDTALNPKGHGRRLAHANSAREFRGEDRPDQTANWGGLAPGGRRAVSGTSFATAVISGALLRMPACNGGRDPGAMKAQVAGLAQDLGVPGRDAVFGAGLFRLSAGEGK